MSGMPVSGSSDTTMPGVMYGPPSFGLYFGTGQRRRSMSSPVMTSSWQGALPENLVGGIGLSRPLRTLSKIVSSSASNASSALLRVE